MFKRKKSLPLVSIIVNCYNGEKYLDFAIKSILNQNYKNWELIFFDNNSKDDSRSIIKKYKDKNKSERVCAELYHCYFRWWSRWIS